MGIASIWAVGAILAALVAGASAGSFAFSAARRRKAAASVLAQGKRDRLNLLLQSGCVPLVSAANKLLSVGAVRKTCIGVQNMLEESGFATSASALLSLVLLAMFALFAGTWLLTGAIATGAAVAVVALIAIYMYAHNRLDRRSVAMREQIPEAMRSMSTCFRSGLSLVQTMEQAGKECGGSLGKLFGVAERRLNMGLSTSEALSVMRGNSQVPELAFVAVALDVQHQSGGSIAPVLEAARDSVLSEIDLMRSLRIQTAQAKLSASIVTIMPFLLIALFSLISPGFLSPFFESVAGMGLLCLALVMQLVGVMLVRHMLKVDAG